MLGASSSGSHLGRSTSPMAPWWPGQGTRGTGRHVKCWVNQSIGVVCQTSMEHWYIIVVMIPMNYCKVWGASVQWLVKAVLLVQQMNADRSVKIRRCSVRVMRLLWQQARVDNRLAQVITSWHLCTVARDPDLVRQQKKEQYTPDEEPDDLGGGMKAPWISRLFQIALI